MNEQLVQLVEYYIKEPKTLTMNYPIPISQEISNIIVADASK